MEKINNKISEKDEKFTFGKPYKFDEYDKKILKELDLNARIPLSTLSRKIGLSRDAIKNRIQKYLDKKVIHAFRPIYNPPNMGFPILNYILFSIYNPSKEREEALIKHLMKKKEVTFMGGFVGKYDFIIGIAAKNLGEFDEIFKSFRHEFSDLIKEYEIVSTLKEHKYDEHGKLIYG